MMIRIGSDRRHNKSKQGKVGENEITRNERKMEKRKD